MSEKNGKTAPAGATGTLRIRGRRPRRPLGYGAAGLGLMAGLVALIILGIALAGCGSTEKEVETATDTVGKLEIPETEYDFGSVPVGETVSHSFEIKNAGNGTLELGEPEIKRLEGC
jgi:hypothetical protein